MRESSRAISDTLVEVRATQHQHSLMLVEHGRQLDTIHVSMKATRDDIAELKSAQMEQSQRLSSIEDDVSELKTGMAQVLQLLKAR